jgi:hypothetical protein
VPNSVGEWLLGKTRSARLRAEIAKREEWIKGRDKRVSAHAQRALDLARSILNSAQARQADLNAAWTLVMHADCVLLEALTDAELRARATTLREEVDEKLTNWRKKGALRLLKQSAANPSLVDVQEALRMLNEHSDNVYVRFDLLADQILRIGLVLLASLIVALIASANGIIPLAAYTSMLGWSMLLGAIGALLSAARTLSNTSRRQKIPEQLADTPVTLMRPIIGAAAGTLAAILVLAGVASIGAKDDRIAPLVAAFLAGFSERFFLSLIPSGDQK